MPGNIIKIHPNIEFNMSSMSTQIHRLIKSLSLNQHCESSLPPQVLGLTKGIIFFKKLRKGHQHVFAPSGIFIKRLDTNTWSNPAVVKLKSGDVCWGKIDGAWKADVLIAITDETVLNEIEVTGHVDFSNKFSLRRGVVVGPENDLNAFQLELKETPELADENHSYAYRISHGECFPCHIEDPLI